MGAEGGLEVRVLVKVVLELSLQGVVVNLEEIVFHLLSAYHSIPI